MKHRLFATILLTSFVCGCAPLASLESLQTTPERTMEQRKLAVVNDFEKHRNRAQVAAASDRYDQGDTAGAVALLEDVLRRAPDHIDALTTLADIQMVSGDPQQAIELRRHLVRLLPNDADQHHALAMLLESNDQFAAAKTHFQKALELEPDNELYQATYDASESAL